MVGLQSMRSKLAIAVNRKLNWGRSDWYWGLSANRAQNPPQKTMGPKRSISEGYKFIQTNLHHSKAATPLLYRKLAIREMDTALIQEPWIYGDWINGLCNRRWKLFSAEPSVAPRSCTSVSNTMYAFPPSKFCSKDMTTVKITLEKGAQENLSLPQHTCDSDEPPPPSKGKLLTTVVGIKSNSSLEVMPVHITLYQAVQT